MISMVLNLRGCLRWLVRIVSGFYSSKAILSSLMAVLDLFSRSFRLMHQSISPYLRNLSRSISRTSYLFSGSTCLFSFEGSFGKEGNNRVEGASLAGLPPKGSVKIYDFSRFKGSLPGFGLRVLQEFFEGRGLSWLAASYGKMVLLRGEGGNTWMYFVVSFPCPHPHIASSFVLCLIAVIIIKSHSSASSPFPNPPFTITCPPPSYPMLILFSSYMDIGRLLIFIGVEFSSGLSHKQKYKPSDCPRQKVEE